MYINTIIISIVVQLCGIQADKLLSTVNITKTLKHIVVYEFSILFVPLYEI